MIKNEIIFKIFYLTATKLRIQGILSTYFIVGTQKNKEVDLKDLNI